MRDQHCKTGAVTASKPTTDLGERWVAAWTYARGLDVERVDGWPLVQVGLASRETELVCVDPGLEAFVGLLPHIAGDPRAMLTLIAADRQPYESLALPPTVRVDRADETLMSTTLARVSAPAIDPGFTSRWDIDDRKGMYAVQIDGRVAAEGTVGIHGEDAVFDVIETSPAFQRRGLGRHVMAVLTTYAVEHGARHGILAASDQGRHLYEALGWESDLEMWSLMGASGQNGPTDESRKFIPR